MTFKIPGFIKNIFPGILWSYSPGQKKIYLTFDDGPHPDITPWVHEQLAIYKARATFFSIGNNIEKHPSVYRNTITLGHTSGNHTFNHLNGWKTPTNEYLTDVYKCKNLVEGNLFRPPYGKLTLKQYNLLKHDFKIVLWDVISHDYNRNLNKELCLKETIRHYTDGSVIVFHDSEKAEKNLKYVLPRFLETVYSRGFSAEAISIKKA